MTVSASVALAPFDWLRGRDHLEAWFDAPHVARWWGPRDVVLQELSAHAESDMALIVAEGRPVGLIVWQVPTREELAVAGHSDLPADLVDIDLMIGAPDAIGRGIGPAALDALFDRLRAQGITRVGIATAVANEQALRAYAKAGFIPWRDFIEAGELHRYLTRDL